MIKPLLKIEGRSGCNLTIERKDNINLVRKTSRSSGYNERLYNQFEKQKYFAEQFPDSFFAAPKVFAFTSADAQQHSAFTMAYIHGEKYSEFFERITVIDLNFVITKLIDFIEHNIDSATFMPVDRDLLINKAEQIEEKLISEKLFHSTFKETIQLLKDMYYDEPVPVGLCHGDLTFSNMIFSDNRIYFVDFLDSFIETPLVDIVKIRQDTKFRWSMLIENNLLQFQRNKVTQVLRFIDSKIDDHFSAHAFYRRWYNYFEKLNLMRILPYLTKENEIEFIENSLKELTI